jgi:hypothetical protein
MRLLLHLALALAVEVIDKPLWSSLSTVTLMSSLEEGSNYSSLRTTVEASKWPAASSVIVKLSLQLCRNVVSKQSIVVQTFQPLRRAGTALGTLSAKQFNPEVDSLVMGAFFG